MYRCTKSVEKASGKQRVFVCDICNFSMRKRHNNVLSEHDRVQISMG